MKRIILLLSVLLTLGIAGPVAADSLELADGTVLEGDFVGSSNGVIMFDTGEGIEAFPEAEVVGVFFSSGVETALAESNASVHTLPAGTRLVIRTTDDIDSKRHPVGHRFRGQLEGALAVDGVTVVPRGTFVHGRITQAQQSRRIAGSSELAMEFTDLMLDDVLVPISTSGLQAQTQNEAGRTAGRTARSAALSAEVRAPRPAPRWAWARRS